MKARLSKPRSSRSVFARRCSRETGMLVGWMTYASMPRARSQRANQKPSRPASKATAMRVIVQPALQASSRQRCSSRSNACSSAGIFFSGCRLIPGTIPPTSQVFWLSSTTPQTVALHSKGTRDRLRSFEGRIGHSIRVGHCGENAFSSPVAPYLLISLDEGCLLLQVQLARHRLRLAMLHAKAMQQCDQARPALVCDAALPFDPGANLARRSRQGFADPGLQFVLLLVRQPAGAALVAEARQALDPIFLIQAEPGPDRVVVDQQHSGDRLAAHPVVQQHQCIGTARQTMGGRSVAGQLDQVLPRFAVKEAGPYHPIGRIQLAPFRKGFFGYSVSPGIDQAVDARRSAEHLAARPEDRPVAEV